MSYIPTEWQTGDTITAEKLNKLENGVAGGGGSTVSVVDASLESPKYRIGDITVDGTKKTFYAKEAPGNIYKAIIESWGELDTSVADIIDGLSNNYLYVVRELNTTEEGSTTTDIYSTNIVDQFTLVTSEVDGSASYTATLRAGSVTYTATGEDLFSMYPSRSL